MSTSESDHNNDSLLAERLARVVAEAVAHVPAYRDALDRLGVRPEQIRGVRDFQTHVPVIDKASWFGAHDVRALCRGASLDDAVGAYTSSGYSGTFSFGLETASDAARIVQRVDAMLAVFFGADQRRTLLVNALPMGVRVPSSLVAVADTGLRADAVHSVIRKLGPEFAQTILIGEHPFLKRVLEEGADAGIDWKSRVVHMVTGAEVMPENFRAYAGGILGHDETRPDRGYIVMSLGISEVGLSIGQETPLCQRIRRLAHGEARLRQALFGEAPFCGTVVRYSPEDYFIETPIQNGRPSLIITTLDHARKVPLVRYATGDWARACPAAEMRDILEASGHDVEPEGLDWPFLLMWGRGRSIVINGTPVFPEQIKEAMYADPAVAAATTANFRMEAQRQRLAVRFQLRPRVLPSADLHGRFEQALAAWTPVRCDVKLIAYHDFREGMELSYQRKFEYL